MSQHDFEIANQGFPSFRSDLNSGLQALASNSAGATEPSTTYAYQMWYDETTDILKMRNGDDDAWIDIGTFDQTNDTFTPSGVQTDKIEEGNSSVEVIDTGTGYIQVNVDGAEVARFDSNGDLLINKTSSSFGTEGVEVQSDRLWVTRDGGGCADFNRLTSDGAIAQFYKDDVAVGSIGTALSGQLTIGGTDTGGTIILDGANDRVQPYLDDTTDVGKSNARFKDLYLSGGVYLGGTGAANYLDDYEEGEWTATFADAPTGGNTSTTATGYFVKVGRMVTVQARLVNIDTTGLTGANGIYIRGLPYGVSDASGISAIRLDRLDFDDLGTTAYCVAAAVVGSSYINIFNISNATFDDVLTVADITASGGSDIDFTLTYFATT